MLHVIARAEKTGLNGNSGPTRRWWEQERKCNPKHNWNRHVCELTDQWWGRGAPLIGSRNHPYTLMWNSHGDHGSLDILLRVARTILQTVGTVEGYLNCWGFTSSSNRYLGRMNNYSIYLTTVCASVIANSAITAKYAMDYQHSSSGKNWPLLCVFSYCHSGVNRNVAKTIWVLTPKR